MPARAPPHGAAPLSVRPPVRGPARAFQDGREGGRNAPNYAGEIELERFARQIRRMFALTIDVHGKTITLAPRAPPARRPGPSSGE